MLYYSASDIHKKRPLELEPIQLETSWFLRFYAWGTNDSIPTLSNLVNQTKYADSIESLAKLLKTAKKELSQLEKQSLLPNWSIFNSLNKWIKSFLTDELGTLKSLIKITLSEAVQSQKPAKLDFNQIEGLEKISHSLFIHKKEIDNQPVEKPRENYAELVKKINENQKSIDWARNHREHLITRERPLGKPFVFFNGFEYQLDFGRTSPEMEKVFQQRLERLDKEMIPDINQKKELKNRLSQFFPPIDQQKRTKQALASLGARLESENEYHKII